MRKESIATQNPGLFSQQRRRKRVATKIHMTIDKEKVEPSRMQPAEGPTGSDECVSLGRHSDSCA